jgi:hypothetical protein
VKGEEERRRFIEEAFGKDFVDNEDKLKELAQVIDKEDKKG